MDFLVSKVVKVEDDIIVGNQQLLMQVNEVIEKQINEHNDNNQLFNKVETLEDTLKQMKSIVDKVNEEVREFFERPVGASFLSPGTPEKDEQMSFQKIESSPARFNAIELDELKSRFKKLQYDYNKSTTDLRREIKDMVDSCSFLYPSAPCRGGVQERT